jgi:hypothetical protein
MATYNVEDIKYAVRVALYENGVDEKLLEDEDTDTLLLDELIGAKIEEAVRRVEKSAPVFFLETGHDFGSAVYWTANGSGYVKLPDDFMRLVCFKMSDWERTVYEAIGPDDARYALQTSRYAGVRGNKQKPVCAIVVEPEGRRLEFYSSGKSQTAKVDKAVYVPFKTIDDTKGIDISDRCYESVVYTTASLTLAARGLNEQATVLSELAQSLLE